MTIGAGASYSSIPPTSMKGSMTRSTPFALSSQPSISASIQNMDIRKSHNGHLTTMSTRTTLLQHTLCSLHWQPRSPASIRAMSMTIPEECPNAGFIGDVDATASATSGADRSMTEPEERGCWGMHTGFAGAANAHLELTCQ